MDCPICGTDIRMDHEAFETVKNETNIIRMPNETRDAAMEAIGLLNCMAYGGEAHSTRSQAIVQKALTLLRGLE